jgi:hypothetical protein
MKADTLVALCVPHSVNIAHDGGILIQDFRIARAALICPLSQREDLDPRFGTRHRGALGVSEETDALVIVASEERGEVRAVEGGFITEALERAELEDVILAWLDRPTKKVDDETDAPSTTQIRMSKASVGVGGEDGAEGAAQSGLRVVADDGEARP